VSAIAYNPFDPALYRDPYPVYRRLRDEAPLYRNEALGLVALTRFADVVDAHADVQRFSSELNLSQSEAADTGRSRPIVFTDPPYHTRLRSLVNAPFRPRRIERLAPMIRKLTAARLEAFRGRGEVDFAAEVALPIPMQVICHLLGVPDEDVHDLQEWADTSIERQPGTNRPTQAATEARRKLDDYLRKSRIDRLANPRDDMLSVLANGSVEDERGERHLSEDEFIANASFLAIAGNETTAKAITHAALLLWEHPEQRAMLVADPSAIPAAVEEILRFRPPAHWQHRVAAREIAMYGETIAPGTFVALVTASACRDERAFPDPDRFDITRRMDRHAAFGWGRHICMGAWLARLEIRITLEELLARYPDYEIVEDSLVQNYAINVSGYARMEIRI
jgi:cytochrome P450